MTTLAPRSRPYDKNYRSQLRNTLDDEPTTLGNVGIEVHAFILTRERLLAWADRNKYLPDEEDERHRSFQALGELTRKLRLPIHTDLLAIMVGPPGKERPIPLAILGTNESEDELKRALNPAKIQKFKSELGVVEEPLWYLGPFYWD